MRHRHPWLPVAFGLFALLTASAVPTPLYPLYAARWGFGSGVVVPGWGISLQNRGYGFVLDPASPNVVAPGKRPFHTIIPGFLSKDGAPVMSFGVMGGPMQPQGHLQVVSRIVDYGQNPQSACDGPRFRWAHGLQV